MKPTTPHRVHSTEFGLESIRVKIWTFCLEKNLHNIPTMLDAYNLDSRPSSTIPSDEQITYRFSIFDWNNSLREILSSNNIAYELADEISISKQPSEKPARKKVTLLEDDLDVLFAMHTMLSDAGYDVLPSHLAGPLLSTTAEHADIFILDKNISDVDGIEVCRQLRVHPATVAAPVIVISADRDASMPAREAGASCFLAKPFKMEKLLSLVSLYANGTANSV